MVGEVARNKALAIALGKAKVADAAGNAVDLAEFTAVAPADEAEADVAAADDVEATADEAADVATAEATVDVDAETEAPKKPARKRATKKADAE